MFKISYSKSDIMQQIADHPTSLTFFQKGCDHNARYMLIVHTNSLLQKIINAFKKVVIYFFDYKSISLNKLYSVTQNHVQPFITDPFNHYLTIDPINGLVIATQGNLDQNTHQASHEKAFRLLQLLSLDKSIYNECIAANAQRISSVGYEFYSVREQDIQPFIKNPHSYYLKIQDDGSITAVLQNESNEDLHKQALAFLKKIPTISRNIITSCSGAEEVRRQRVIFLQKLAHWPVRQDAAQQGQRQPASDLTAPSAQNSSASFIPDLQQWVDDPTKSPEEKRQEAAKRIRECYNQRSATLDLSNLNLKSLPPCITCLTTLTMLNIGNNPDLRLSREFNQWLPKLQRLLRK